MPRRWLALAEKSTHVFVTEDPEIGYSAESPQLHGFACGRRTISEFTRDYKAAPVWAGATGHVVTHWQVRGASTSGREWVMRWRTEEPEDHERMRLGNLLRRILSGPEGETLLAEAVANSLDEVVFVLSVQTDSLADVAAQLDDRGDALVIVAPVGDEGIWTTQVATSAGHEREQWPSAHDRGWTLQMSIGELMTKLGIESGPRERLLLPALRSA